MKFPEGYLGQQKPELTGECDDWNIYYCNKKEEIFSQAANSKHSFSLVLEDAIEKLCFLMVFLLFFFNFIYSKALRTFWKSLWSIRPWQGNILLFWQFLSFCFFFCFFSSANWTLSSEETANSSTWTTFLSTVLLESDQLMVTGGNVKCHWKIRYDHIFSSWKMFWGIFLFIKSHVDWQVREDFYSYM